MPPARIAISLLTATAAACALTACAQFGAAMHGAAAHPRPAAAAVAVARPAPAPADAAARAGAALHTLVTSPCFGAGANAPAARCDEPALTSGAFPPPSVAAATPNAACNSRVTDGGLYTCWFGTQRAPSRTIALIGDSHAAMWRATLAPIANDEGWRGVSIVHPGCPFSALTRDEGGPQRNAACASWRVKIIPWLRLHPRDRHDLRRRAEQQPIPGPDPADELRRRGCRLPADLEASCRRSITSS